MSKLEWHTVELQDRDTGERYTTTQKAIDQDDANQRIADRIADGDLAGYGLLVVID